MLNIASAKAGDKKFKKFKKNLKDPAKRQKKMGIEKKTTQRHPLKASICSKPSEKRINSQLFLARLVLAPSQS